MQAVWKFLGLARDKFRDDEAYLQGRITFSFALVYALSWLLYVPLYIAWLENWPAAILCLLGGFCSAAYGAYVIRTNQDIERGGIWANLGGCLSLLAIATVTGGMYSPIIGWIFFGTITTFLCHGRKLGLLIVGTSWVGIISIDLLHTTGWLKTYSFPFGIESGPYHHFIILAHITIIPALGFVTSLFDQFIRKAFIQAQTSKQIADANLGKLRFVFKSLSYGVLTIEQDGKTGHDYSEALESILEESHLGGRDAVPSLFSHATLSPDAQQKLNSAVQACMNEPEIAFQMNEDCFPRELEFNFGARKKLVELDWKPMLDKEGQIQKILLSLKDVTEQRELATKATKLSQDFQLLLTLVMINKEHFFSVLKSGQKNISESRQLLQQSKDLSLETVKILLMNVHTVKGECRSIQLQDVVEEAHQLEEFCQLMKQNPAKYVLDRNKALNGLDEMERLLQRYLQVASEYLGWSDAETHLQIAKAELIRILDQTPEQLHVQQEALQLMSYLRGLLFISLDTFVDDLQPIAQRLARDLDKAPPRFERNVPFVYLRESGKMLLQRIFTHLLRNAMDHGIESASDRLVKGKEPGGLLRIHAERQGSELLIRFSDDGQGLNLSAIKAKAVDLGYQPSDMTLQDLCQLIFVEGLSTASRISEISGRGVGMSAIRLYAEEAGAKLELQVLNEALETEQVNFEIVLILPDSHFVV